MLIKTECKAKSQIFTKKEQNENMWAIFFSLAMYSLNILHAR